MTKQIGSTFPIREIALSSIAAHGCQRLRNPDNYDKLTELAKSMNESGLINPIAIRPHGTGYSIVAGFYRLMAATLLKWETIKCYVRQDLDDDGAALIEIHENLIRADLTPGEKRDHLIKRKEIWERRHPEDKQQAGRDDPPVKRHGHRQPKGFAAPPRGPACPRGRSIGSLPNPPRPRASCARRASRGASPY